MLLGAIVLRFPFGTSDHINQRIFGGVITSSSILLADAARWVADIKSGAQVVLQYFRPRLSMVINGIATDTRTLSRENVISCPFARLLDA